MLLFAALVAGSFSLGATIASKIDPMALTALRFTIGATLLVALAASSGKIRRQHFAAPWRYALLGACMALYFVYMFEGLKTASAVSTSALFTLTPLLAAGFGWLLIRQRTSARIALALATGAFGALWVIFRADFNALLAFDIGPGEAIFCLGVLAHALYTPLVPTLNRGEPTIVFTAGMLTAGSIGLMALSFSEVISTDWSAFSTFNWASLAYLSLITTAFTFFLVQFAAMRLPASKVMAYTYLTPSMVILWNTALGAPTPPAILLPGIGLTILALILLLRD